MSLPLHFQAFLLLCSFYTAVAKQSLMDVVPPDYMPPPWLDTASLCQPRHPSSTLHQTSAVCDPSALLSRRQLSHLNSILSDIYTGTPPYSLVSCNQSPSDYQYGFRVAVALVRRMAFDGRTLSSRAETFANTIFHNWNLNQDCGASVLLFLSLEDKRIFIRTGPLAVKYLSENQIDRVYAKIIPQLEKGRLSAALEAGVYKIGTYLSKYKGKPGYTQITDQKPKGASVPLFFRYGPEWWDLELSIVVSIALALLVIACCNGMGGPEAARKRRERRHVLRKLDIVRAEYVSAMIPQYVPSTCPYCQDDLSVPWVPTVPRIDSTGEGLQNSDVEEGLQPKPVRTLRCGHTFHEACFDDEHPGLGSSIPACPVCKDRGGGTSTPAPLSDSRQQDLSFRLHRLHEEYPHIISDSVLAKLESESPNTWPETMTDAYLRRITRSQEGELSGNTGSGWWSGIGGLLAAGGLGALMASMFGRWGRRSGEGSYYTDIPSANAGGHVGQWGAFNGSRLGGGGHGAGWGNALSDAASRFSGGGLGRGWGFGGGGGGGGGGGHGSGW